MKMDWLFRVIAAPMLGLGVLMPGELIAQMSPIATRHLYSETADPNADIAAALQTAKREHKRVLLDFGGDWCGDCQVLDIYMHRPPNQELLDNHFVVVHVWVGHLDQHVDIASRYHVPINKGVPAMAVLAADGRILFSPGPGQFSKMRTMTPETVTAFLNEWRPTRRG